MSNPTTAAELSAAAEAIGGYTRRVSRLAEEFTAGDRDDLVSAIYEAERALAIAERTIRRALRLASS